MDRDSLIERANRWTVPRYGVTITERRLRDWVDEELVAPPHRVKNQGRRAAAYDWSPESYLGVLKVARAKRDGLDTFDKLRVDLWLRGHKPITQAVRQSMISEYRRMQKELYRSRRGETDSALSKKIENPNSKKRYIGDRTDSRLKPFSKFIDERTAFTWHRAYRFGAEFDFMDSFQNVISSTFGFNVNAGQLPSPSFTVSGVGQIPEDKDEILAESAEFTLSSAPAESMNKIRRLCRCLVKIADAPFILTPKDRQVDEGILSAFREVARQTSHFQWRFFMFYMFLHATRQCPLTDDFLDLLEHGLPMNIEIG